MGKLIHFNTSIYYHYRNEFATKKFALKKSSVYYLVFTNKKTSSCAKTQEDVKNQKDNAKEAKSKDPLDYENPFDLRKTECEPEALSEDEITKELTNLNESFKKGERPLAYYQEFLRLNTALINLLERIKFEAFSGYPVMQQSVFHYIYESRYTNAIFGVKNTVGNVLITNYFLPFLNNGLSCFYNQMYFWCIIGSMHPSLLMGNLK